jgi:microsomal dipeptidase-like Zn-dependent dipeptidase
MHVIGRERADTRAAVRSAHPDGRWKAIVVDLLSRLFNYQGPNDTPSVTVERMREGDVGAILSVLFAPFDEMDLELPYGAAPRGRYVDSILQQLQDVEAFVENEPLGATIARDPAALDAAIEAGQSAIVHCIEGGFALGGTPAEVDANVTRLAARGVAYVTIAHLFWREVATNAPALPFMPDALYRRVFAEPAVGLTMLGRAAVAAMAREGVLVDITHMSDRAVDETFATLPADVPVIASHIGCRFAGSTEYNLRDETIREIARRRGIMGVIVCEHWASAGPPKRKLESFDDSFTLVRAHIDRIHEVTGSHEFTGIGSDLDGWIKPALPELEHLGRMRRLQEKLAETYGAEVAAQIAGGNALGLLRRAWRGAPRVSPT